MRRTHEPELGDAHELLADWELQAVGEDQLPDGWRVLFDTPEPADRCRTALSGWPPPVVEALPRFAAALTARLTDVQPALCGAVPVLAHLARGDDGGPRAWVGFPPLPPGSSPPWFWPAVPAFLRTFSERWHAGFVAADGESCGPLPPKLVRTLAERAGGPDGIPGWDGEGRISSTRLVRVATNGALLDYCVSPDLPAGRLALVYEGDIDPQDAGEALDALMLSGFDGGPS
jgi:hypothetical protein